MPKTRTDKERFADLDWLQAVVENAQGRLTADQFDGAEVDAIDRRLIKTALANAATCIHALKRERST